MFLGQRFVGGARTVVRCTPDAFARRWAGGEQALQSSLRASSDEAFPPRAILTLIERIVTRANEDYAVLLAVVDHGSLTAAAAALGRSLQSVSRTLAAIEQSMNVSLFARTTRRVQPTAACLAFVNRIRPAVHEIEAAREELREQQIQLRGAIRMAAPPAVGARFAAPAVATFLRTHGALSCELRLSEQHVDLAAQGIDLALRLGELPASNLRARRVGSLRRVLFGAPGYFAARGYPQVPADLTAHDCVVRAGGHDVWHFGRDVPPVAVRGRFLATTADACVAAALAGCGIARVPLWQIREHADAGRAEIVLADYEPQPVAAHLVWPTGKALPRRVRALIDHLVATLAQEFV